MYNVAQWFDSLSEMMSHIGGQTMEYIGYKLLLQAGDR